jgi:OPA family glycerol-3-phosphate transporter-like MFS transporter
MCRYNFRWAVPGMAREFGLEISDITAIFATWSLAYGTGQLINGLLSDRIGGKVSMLIGAVATIIISLVFGLSSIPSTVATISFIWLVNGYFQAFGAPGMVKMNAAWFHANERGTFSGIFGIMIQMGQISINGLAPYILGGFAIFGWGVEKGEWRLLFIIPPIFTAIAATFMLLVVRPTPDDAGFPGVVSDDIDNSSGATVPLAEAFKTIFTHPLVWFYAVAYACTGAVRTSSDQLATLYFEDSLGLDLNEKPKAVLWTMTLMPVMAIIGSIAAGYISDRAFKGRRAPVAAVLYFIEGIVITCAAIVVHKGLVDSTSSGIFIGCLFLVLISLTVNSTHSLVGAAAPMDIGGKKMAGFACGVIDSFQYYGGALSLFVTGYVMSRTQATHGWLYWFVIMAGFGFMGGFTMLWLALKQRREARSSLSH